MYPELTVPLVVLTAAALVALPGWAVSRLLEVSAGAGVLVVGTRGGAGLPATARGSITRVLTRRAHCPVVIARCRGSSVGFGGVLGPCRWVVGVGRLGL